MPKKTTDAEAALQKLGQRLRAGIAKQHPAPSLETVRGAMRDQYEQEQAAERGPTIEPPNPTRNKEREPYEPEQER